VGIAIAQSIIKSGKRKDVTDDELAALVYNIGYRALVGYDLSTSEKTESKMITISPMLGV